MYLSNKHLACKDKGQDFRGVILHLNPHFKLRERKLRRAMSHLITHMTNIRKRKKNQKMFLGLKHHQIITLVLFLALFPFRSLITCRQFDSTSRLLRQHRRQSSCQTKWLELPPLRGSSPLPVTLLLSITHLQPHP